MKIKNVILFIMNKNGKTKNEDELDRQSELPPINKRIVDDTFVHTSE